MRRQLAIVVIATTTTVVIAFLVPLAVLVRTVAVQRAMRPVELAAQSIAPVLALTDDPPLLQATLAASQGRTGASFSVSFPDGTLVGDGPAAHASVEEVRQARRATTLRTEQGRELLSPVVLPGGGVAVVRAFVPAAALERGVLPAWVVLGVLGFALVVIAVAIADRLGRSTVRAAQDLDGVARRLAAGELGARASPTDLPELTEVGAALNHLAGRIQALLAAEREAAADLSHRLRTPLTALRIDAESLPDSEAAREVAADVAELERAVDRVIAQARRPADARDETTDVARIVRERAAFWEALAEDQGRACVTSVPDAPAVVGVAQDDVDALVDALIGNVFAHTPEGTAYRVAVTPGADGSRVTLVVEDEGPGLADPALAGRGVSAAGSTGLGLDIVHRVAEAAGGRVTLHDREGGGLRVEVSLPTTR